MFCQELLYFFAFSIDNKLDLVSFGLFIQPTTCIYSQAEPFIKTKRKELTFVHSLRNIILSQETIRITLFVLPDRF